MGCSSSQPRKRRRRRRRNRGTLETVPERVIKVPVYQADRSEFEGEGQTYRSELYGQEEQEDPLYDHKVEQGIKFKQATYNGIHNIKVHHEDRAECRVRGAEFLPNGNLLLCDQNNCKLKLFNSAFKYMSHYTLPGRPHELCVHSSDKEGCDVYVTVPSERTVMEFFIEERVFVLGQRIRIDGWCYGIAPYKNGLVVSSGTKIIFMDTDGHVFKSLQFDQNGDSIFESPFHIAVSAESNILVSDLLRRCVICLTPNGDVIYRYSHLTIPHGLFVDSDGYVYLCGANEEAIDVLHQISKGGDKIKSLLSWRHVGFRPDTVCLRESDQMLAVCGENDRIKTFKLHTVRTGRLYSNDAIMGESLKDGSTGGRSTPEVQEEMKRILKS